MKSPPYVDCSKQSCGQIDVKGFAINLEGYNESKKFNSCLNRKLSLNLHNGDIKNCSSMPESFGNLHTDNVSDIIKTSNFQRLWNITKSNIDKCKICEFKDICTDC